MLDKNDNCDKHDTASALPSEASLSASICERSTASISSVSASSRYVHATIRVLQRPYKQASTQATYSKLGNQRILAIYRQAI
jgi:hypothetical protein